MRYCHLPTPTTITTTLINIIFYDPTPKSFIFPCGPSVSVHGWCAAYICVFYLHLYKTANDKNKKRNVFIENGQIKPFQCAPILKLVDLVFKPWHISISRVVGKGLKGEETVTILASYYFKSYGWGFIRTIHVLQINGNVCINCFAFLCEGHHVQNCAERFLRWWLVVSLLLCQCLNRLVNNLSKLLRIYLIDHMTHGLCGIWTNKN